MTEQPTRDQLRALANEATPGPWEVRGDELAGTGIAHCCMPPGREDRADMDFIAAARTAAPQLLDQLDQAEARIRHLEATAQVLVKEALDAENARDENRRGKAEAEARIKAVQHLIDQADEMGEWAITCTRLQRAIDGSNPPPGA